MRIMVTGAAGFTGSNLVDKLLDQGHKVIALAHVNKGWTDELKEHGAEVIFGDIRDKKQMDELVGRVDIVINVAAAFLKINAPDDYYDSVNIEGTRILLDAAVKHKIKRFVHCSTCGVHGETTEVPATEESPFGPLDHYQESKLQGELLVHDYIKKGVPASIIRPFGVYGPRDTRLLKIFRMLKKGRFVMFGDGKALYQLGYIDNLTDAFILAMTKKEAIGNAYLIGHEKTLTLDEMIGMIAKELGVKPPKTHFPVWPLWTAGLICEIVCKPFGISPPLFRRRVNFFVKDRSFDISKAKRELGFKPKVGLKEGIRRTIKWNEERGLL